jgi:hypothetical protein
MQILLIVIAIACILGAIIYVTVLKKSYEVKMLSLQHQLQTASEEAAQKPVLISNQSMTGDEFLKQFAAAHQITLNLIDTTDEDFNLYEFAYQGDTFAIWVSNQNDALFLRTGTFAVYPCLEDFYWPLLRYCYQHTLNHSYVKLKLSIEDTDPDKKEVHLYLSYELIGISATGLEFLLNNSFNIRREARQELDQLFNEVQQQPEATQPATQATEEMTMQEMAMQMTMDKANEQKNENQDKDGDENWSY